MRKQTRKWTMKDGSKIRICDMSDKHLLNSIRLCERYSVNKMYYEHMKFLSYPEPNGEMAQDAYDQALDRMAQESPDDYLPSIYYHLLDDKERRGLQ